MNGHGDGSSEPGSSQLGQLLDLAPNTGRCAGWGGGGAGILTQRGDLINARAGQANRVQLTT